MDFKLVSEYEPTGDQPQAIQQIVEGINAALVTWLASNAIIEAKREGLSAEDMALRNEISGSSVNALEDDTSRWEWWKSHAKQFGESVKEFSWTSLFK